MTEQQQSACAELARRIGWREGELAGIWFPPDGNLKRVQTDPPEYFTDPAASRELVAWLAADDERWLNFLDEYQITAGWKYGLWQSTLIKVVMTAPLPVIARAACEALGIEVSE